MAGATVDARGTKNGRDWGTLLKRVLLYGALTLLTLLFVAPLLWMLSTSFKTNAEAIQNPPTWIPQAPSTEGYSRLMRSGSEAPVLRWFLNSMIAALSYTALVLISASMAAYALARMSFRGKRIAFGLVISTLFIPPISFFVPNYLIVDSFGWLDTLLAVIVPPAAGAFGVFFMRQFFLSLPRELEEAAMLDGANRLQIFFRIILPLSKAPLATLAVLSFLVNWNELLWPLYVLFNAANYTLPPGLGILQGAYTTEYAVIMAGGVIASVPVLIIFIFAQRYIIEGVARSGLKG
jgi:multiple sugar transport system permease protein